MNFDSILSPEGKVYLFYSLIFIFIRFFYKDILGFYYTRVKWKNPIPRETYFRYHGILKGKISYYNRLSEKGKIKFINRLYRTLETKEFAGAENLEITEEKKVLVTAAIVQLTFGLENYTLSHISRILLYPQAFYSRFFDQYIKGLTSTAGAVTLSWKEFSEGYNIDDDRYNLGLHEMAHALKLSVIKDDDFDSRFEKYLKTWLEIGSVEFKRMKKDGESFLRMYGGQNMHEFFAVCVEHFFEAPLEFKQNLPDIYNHLCVLLNQNPLNQATDYRIKDTFSEEINRDKSRIPVPKWVKKKISRSGNGFWTLNIFFAGFFSIFLIPFLVSDTFVDWEVLLKICGITALLSGIVQFGPVVLRGYMDFHQFVVYHLFGVLPLICFSILLFNNYLSYSSTSGVYRIKDVGGNYSEGVIFSLEDFEYNRFGPKFSDRVHWGDVKRIPAEPGKESFLQIALKNGFFGFPVFESGKLVESFSISLPKN